MSDNKKFKDKIYLIKQKAEGIKSILDSVDCFNTECEKCAFWINDSYTCSKGEWYSMADYMS